MGPVFTDDLVVFLDGHDLLHAVDRATGRERWRVKRRSAGKGGDTPCSITHPTPESQVVAPGVVVDVFSSDGGRRTRYRALDPETGELSSLGYSFDRNEAPEVPGFALPYAADQSIGVGDSSVFTPMILRGMTHPSAIARLDLGSGEATWSWAIPGAPKRGYSNVVADVVSASPDGAVVYVRTAVNLDVRLWELDATTGERLRGCELCDKDRDVLDLYDSDVSIDDGDVFQLSTRRGSATLLGALYR
ncbi:MAG: hypothetical protein JWN68_281 [Nocardioides sp.]|nr:hypothetical protein [Nocardioides sp.]